MFRELKEIKKTRKKLGLSQKELARESGVSQSMIAKVESGKLVPSYNKAVKIFRALSKNTKKVEMRARDIINPKIISARPGDSIQKVLEEMKENSISQVPVLEEGRPVGLVTETSLLEEVGEHPDRILKEKVTEVMEEPPPVISLETPLEVISLLLRHFPIVLVTKNGKLTGLVTKADILEEVSKA